MEGISPQHWVADDQHMLTDDLVSAAFGSALDVVPSWLMALPHAAALIDVKGGRVHTEFSNPLFRQIFHNSLRAHMENENAYVDKCCSALTAFSVSGHGRCLRA